MAAISAAQNGGMVPTARPTIPYAPPTPVSLISLQQSSHGDAPTPPGMMDIEMDDHQSIPGMMLNTTSPTTRLPLPSSAPSSPWASAFRPQLTSSQGVPPSLLSFSNPGYPSPSLNAEQLEAKAFKKAQRKAERLAREETAVSDAEGDKRFPCPIEGCGKVYKQANGLKYHLTRSINSGHGNVAALGLAALLGDRPGEGSVG
jgi:transcription factor SFP1